jgi:hypothetical protein
VVPGQSIVGRFPVNGPYAVTLAGYSAATTTPQSHVPQPVSVPYQLVLTIG